MMETGTLGQLLPILKVGMEIEWIGGVGRTREKVVRVITKIDGLNVSADDCEEWEYLPLDEPYRIISRSDATRDKLADAIEAAEDEDMDDGAKAAAPADEIEWGEWVDNPICDRGYFNFQYQIINSVQQWRYPVKREPVVETVTLGGCVGKKNSGFGPGVCGDDTHRITLTIIDGVVQPTATVEALQ